MCLNVLAADVKTYSGGDLKCDAPPEMMNYNFQIKCAHTVMRSLKI